MQFQSEEVIKLRFWHNMNSNAQLSGPGNGGNSFPVTRLRPPQTAACHVSRQRRQTRHAAAAAANAAGAAV